MQELALELLLLHSLAFLRGWARTSCGKGIASHPLLQLIDPITHLRLLGSSVGLEGGYCSNNASSRASQSFRTSRESRECHRNASPSKHVSAKSNIHSLSRSLPSARALRRRRLMKRSASAPLDPVKAISVSVFEYELSEGQNCCQAVPL